VAGPHPAVAAVRLAVRRVLRDTPEGQVLVACSGGADSLALLTGAVFETRDTGRRVVGATVDHGLQDGSGQRAVAVGEQMAALGADETMTIRVRVDSPGMGPEAAARQARYAALGQAAQHVGATVVLLGHTRDDQAETVLLGLARGSGGRSIAGMRRSYAEDGTTYLRPLLDLTRAETEAACTAQDVAWWSDPHNDDPRFTRSRLRQRVLPLLEEELGPGVAASLARTADLLRDDLAALEEIADRTWDEVRVPGGLDAPALAPLPVATRRRVLRRSALEAGCPPGELFRVHVEALADLATGSGGGTVVQLPGHVTAHREGGLLLFRRTPTPHRPGCGGVAG
jgi:tRNA(Ile)-lysidine synthase